MGQKPSKTIETKIESDETVGCCISLKKVGTKISSECCIKKVVIKSTATDNGRNTIKIKT